MTAASFVAYSSDDKLARGGYQGREVYAKRYDEAKVAEASEASRIKLTVREKRARASLAFFFPPVRRRLLGKVLEGKSWVMRRRTGA